ncbi:hypothetical protein EDB84DRAFT_1628875 [Lactarius hengduanensis]|nr:hypothetical protein EDB84DRAFT_1628875 [Lactarius hengduanensis]
MPDSDYPKLEGPYYTWADLRKSLDHKRYPPILNSDVPVALLSGPCAAGTPIERAVTGLAGVDLIQRRRCCCSQEIPLYTRGIQFILPGASSDRIDCGAGRWVGNNLGGNSWGEPFKTWQNAYTFDPLANLTAAQAPLVLGGQQSP